MHLSTRALAIFLFFSLAVPLLAQNRMIRGRVIDDKGRPIAGAAVSIRTLDSQARKYDVRTDGNGVYVLMGIPTGDYRVVARAPGYSPNFISSVKPSLQMETAADIVLTPGPDQKLPFELTAEEVEDIRKEMEKAEKRREVAPDVQALFDEGLQLAEEGKHLEAIEKYREALAKDPEQANILGHMADSYTKLNKNDEALEAYRQAIAVKPDDATLAALYTNMGVLLSTMGKDAESQEAFKKAADLDPASSAQSYYNIGATLFNKGRTDEAAVAFRQAIEADPDFDEAYYQLGMSLANKPETMAEAVQSLRKYIEIGTKPEQVETAKQVIAALEQSMKQ
ncbi:MAG: tetratricopeptide repeat protein [Acidobacteria bacterium]|nr:tetratricopeptide repeat protein [Acidobacteriota bacterium]